MYFPREKGSVFTKMSDKHGDDVVLRTLKLRFWGIFFLGAPIVTRDLMTNGCFYQAA